MSGSKHIPKGPNGAWITGQRVPEDGWYADQYGVIVHFEKKSTFPPRVGRNTGGGVAYWTLHTMPLAEGI